MQLYHYILRKSVPPNSILCEIWKGGEGWNLSSSVHVMLVGKGWRLLALVGFLTYPVCYLGLKIHLSLAETEWKGESLACAGWVWINISRRASLKYSQSKKVWRLKPQIFQFLRRVPILDAAESHTRITVTHGKQGSWQPSFPIS